MEVLVEESKNQGHPLVIFQLGKDVGVRVGKPRCLEGNDEGSGDAKEDGIGWDIGDGNCGKK